MHPRSSRIWAYDKIPVMETLVGWNEKDVQPHLHIAGFLKFLECVIFYRPALEISLKILICFESSFSFHLMVVSNHFFRRRLSKLTP